MAFVDRSSKNIDKIEKKEESDEYNSLKDKIDLIKEKRESSILNNNSSCISNNSKIKAPFGTLSKKGVLLNSKAANVPGPGTYDYNDHLVKKQFNKNNTSPDITEFDGENKKRIFISQQDRFNKDQYETDVPGPGKYYKENLKKVNNVNNNTLSNQIFIYSKDLYNYEPFSTRRILSIPSKGYDFGYEIYGNGVLKLIEDPNKNKKHSGDKNNSVGPGQYDNYYNQKNEKIGIIDWNKSIHRSINKKKEKEKEKNKEKETDIARNTQNNSIQYDSNFYLSNTSTEPTINSSLSVMNFNKKNRTKNYFYTNTGFDRNNIEVKFSNTKIYKNDNFSRTINRNNLSPFFKLDTKPEIEIDSQDDKISPGPGAYLSLNNFNIIPKDEKHQFFGSSMSRGILYPSLTNNLKIGKNSLENILDIDNVSKIKINKSKSLNSNINNKKNKKLKNKNPLKKIDKAELIKEISKNIKKDLNNKIGPGSYNPEKKIKNTYSYEVGNFGSLERRFPLFPSHDESPGVGKYYHLETWGPKKKTNTLDKIIPPNISKRIREGISVNKMGLFRDKIMKENHKQPIIGQYSIENINTIESNTKHSISVSKNQPGFGSSFKRFYIFKNQINEKNGVGNYDLKYPEVKIYQQNAAFLGSAGRNDIDDNKKKNIINPLSGPGSYRKDSYFDWNIKSYNIIFN